MINLLDLNTCDRYTTIHWKKNNEKKKNLITFNYNQPVSGRNKCMCSSSQARCYGRMRSCAIHNSFALSGEMSFMLAALKSLNVSEPKD